MSLANAESGEPSEVATFEFPTDMCCNCATRDTLVPVLQDTRLARYMGMGGVEYRLDIYLPFCNGCAPTAKRRAPTLLHRVLVFGLILPAVLLGTSVVFVYTGAAWLMENAVLVAVGIALGLTVAFYVSQRPSGAQSSVYQPVRILKLRQRFFTGEIFCVRFGFTNHAYADRFTSVNHGAVSVGRVEVVKV